LREKTVFHLTFPCGERRVLSEDEWWPEEESPPIFAAGGFDECDMCAHSESRKEGYFCEVDLWWVDPVVDGYPSEDEAEGDQEDLDLPDGGDLEDEECVVIWVDFKKRRWARL
jgi:hypothetical protein